MAQTPSSRIRLATASPATQPTKEETLQQMRLIAKQAGDQNADILVLPEAYIGGYPRGSTFGCAIGARSNEGRDEYLRYFSEAVDLGDTVNGGAGGGEAWVRREIGGRSKPYQESRQDCNEQVDGDGIREVIETIANQTGVFLVVGLIERAGGSLYCSVVYVCPKHGMVGKRRKVMPTATERLVWAQGSPATLKAITTTIRGVRINLAAAICWENYMPLLRQALYSQNINLYLAPTADGRDTWLPLMQSIGIEGRCFVVSSNMCVRDSRQRVHDSNLYKPHPSFSCEEPLKEESNSVQPKNSPDARSFLSRGGSCIVSPFGEVLAGPQWEDEKNIVFVDVDFKNCIRGRLDLDVAGSYSRNDSFNFSVKGLDLRPLPYY